MNDPHDVLEVIRPRGVYVKWQTYAGLGHVAQASHLTRDELAEQIMAEWLHEHYPDVVKFMKARYDQEKEFVKTIKPL